MNVCMKFFVVVLVEIHEMYNHIKGFFLATTGCVEQSCAHIHYICESEWRERVEIRDNPEHE